MTESISVFLTTAQRNKMQGGKTFQLSASQIQSGTGKHNVDIEMTSKDYKQLLKNVSKNKGFRFTPDKVVGSGIFKDISKKLAKKIAPKILDEIGNRTGQKGITDALKKSSDDLIDIGADKITGGKLKKGSPEMRAHMARLRGMRKGKGVNMEEEIDGGNIFDDVGRKIKRGFNKTFNPALGRKIKSALTSDTAKGIYKDVADVGIDAVGAYTGNPLLAKVGSRVVDAGIDGLGVGGKRVYKRKNLMVVGGTLRDGVPSVMVRHGGIMRGGSFTSKNGTHYGGSFKSGGSMISP